MNIKLKFFIPILIFVLILHIVFLQKVSIVEKKTKINHKSNFITKVVIIDIPQKKEKLKDSKEIRKSTKKIIKKEKQKKIVKKLEKKVQINKKIVTKIIKKVQIDKSIEKEIKQKNKIDIAKPIKQENKSKLIVKSDKTSKKEQVENLNKYILYINKTIQKNKFYPKIAKNMGIEGKCILKFKILKNGKIAEVNLDKKSKFLVLNKAAVKILEKIGKFKPFPSSLGKEEIVLKIPIKYMLKG